jgi:hypothetical protein
MHIFRFSNVEILGGASQRSILVHLQDERQSMKQVSYGYEIGIIWV